jgi:hypothetical protein
MLTHSATPGGSQLIAWAYTYAVWQTVFAVPLLHLGVQRAAHPIVQLQLLNNYNLWLRAKPRALKLHVNKVTRKPFELKENLLLPLLHPAVP